MQQHMYKRLSQVVSQTKLSPSTSSVAQQIKRILEQFNEFVSQQFIKLSAHYETKLQYQAMDYEQEIGCLKQQIQRQYKVIGLMKSELQDLVILVNQQRNSQPGKHHTQDYFTREQNLRAQEQHKEWRVKKSSSAKQLYQKQSEATFNKPEEPIVQSRSRSTISGLQIITEQQTERTLISVCDEEEEQAIQPEFQNYQEDQQAEADQTQHTKSKSKQLNSPQNQHHQSQTRPHMLIDDDDNSNIQEENHPEQIGQKSTHNQTISQYKALTLLQSHQQNLTQFQKQEITSLDSRALCEDDCQSINHLEQSQQNTDYHDQTQNSQTQQHSEAHHLTSVKSQIYFNSSQTQQKQPTKPPQTNFIENPFAKKKSSHPSLKTTSPTQINQPTSFTQQPLYLQKIKLEPIDNQNESETSEQQFRKLLIENFYQSQKTQAQKKSQTNNVMSILEMIAMSSNQTLYKKSQRSSKLVSSRSKSNGKKQSHKHIKQNHSRNKNSKKRQSTQNKPTCYHLQTQQHYKIDSQNSSRITQARCPTSQDINQSQRYNPKSFDGTESYTPNDFRSQIDHSDKELTSLHTTFGRPTSHEYLKQPLSVSSNRLNTGEDIYINQRKGSIKWKKQVILLKQNYGNKENQRHRRMSEKGPQTKAHSQSYLIEKKMSSKYIKPHSKYSTQQSVHLMMQSHLQNSNKFQVGTKKQQVKYDGQRMSNGNQHIRQGHGTLYYSNGLIYEGEFWQNKRHGFGLLKFNHVQLYSGEWCNDQLQGKGKIRNCAIINKKKTQKSEHMILLMGSNIFGKWISYCGEFSSNRFQGEGTLYLQGGEKFVGLFKNGAADGEGSLYRKNGQIETGIWMNNIMVERIQTQWS